MFIIYLFIFSVLYHCCIASCLYHFLHAIYNYIYTGKKKEKKYITSAGSRVCCCCRILNIIYFYTCTYERVSLRPLQGLRSAVVDNIRRRIVGVMFPPSIFEARCVDFRRSMCQLRCVALRRSMCRPSKIDVTMCRPSEMDVSTFEDR